MSQNSRGLRNRNPLNIKRGGSRWIGRIRPPTDPVFEEFRTMAYGYRAAWLLMRTYHTRLNSAGKGFNIRNIVSTWAPNTENNTEAYIKSVVRLSGLPEFKGLNNPEINGAEVFLVIKAMTCVENGISLEDVSEADIREGYTLAFKNGCLEG